MNQWIERAVADARAERARIVESVSDELALIARIDAAIAALTGEQQQPAVLLRDVSEPEPEAPPEAPPEPEPEPPAARLPITPPRPQPPAPAVTRIEGQATPAMIRAALEAATGPQSTREVLAAVQQQYPEVAGLGNAVAEAIDEGLIYRLDARGQDGFPLLSLDSEGALPVEPPKPKPERKPATPLKPPPGETERSRKARERLEAIRDYLASHGATKRLDLEEKLSVPKGSWGTAHSKGTILYNLAEQFDVRSEILVIDNVKTSFLLLPGQQLPGAGQPSEAQAQDGDAEAAELLMPALKDKSAPRSHMVDAARRQLQVWRAICAYGEPFTILDLMDGRSVFSTDIDQKRVGDYLKAFKDVGYLRETGERRRNTERDGSGKAADVLEITPAAPRPKVGAPREAQSRPTTATAEDEEGTAAPPGGAREFSLELVRDCSRDMEGPFSPAQMYSNLERSYDGLRLSMPLVEEYLKRLAESKIIADISPTPDQQLYEYTKPTGPGKAAELDARRSEANGAGSSSGGGGPVPGTGKPGSAGSGKVDKLLRAVERAGGQWRKSGSGHYLLTLGDGRRTTIGATPNETSHRADILKLRKLGVAV